MRFDIKNASKLIKAIGFLANVDNVTASLSPAIQNCTLSKEVLGIGEIACSGSAIFVSGLLYFSYFCSERDNNVKFFPHAWLTMVLFSCLLSIIGSAFILNEEYNKDNDVGSNGKSDNSLELVGGVLVAVSKILHPALTATFSEPDMIEPIEIDDEEHIQLRPNH